LAADSKAHIRTMTSVSEVALSIISSGLMPAFPIDNLKHLRRTVCEGEDIPQSNAAAHVTVQSSP